MKFERLAFDTNAAVDFLRLDRSSPPQFRRARMLFMPLFVLAELKLGVFRSTRREENLRRLEVFLSRCTLLSPDLATVDHYVHVRQAIERRGPLPTNRSDREGLLNDLWIAALCLQHRLPLLSNDRDFDGIEGLEVLHW